MHAWPVRDYKFIPLRIPLGRGLQLSSAFREVLRGLENRCVGSPCTEGSNPSPSAYGLTLLGRQRFEHEDLDGEVGVEVVVAHEADHLASGQLLDLPGELDTHDPLPPAT